MPFLLALERGFFSICLKFIRAVAPTGVRGRHSSGSCDLQTFLKGVLGSLRGCASTQVHQPGGVSAKRKGGCVGRKSRAAAQFSMTAERHPRLRGGRSEGTNIPAAVQAFGPSWWKEAGGRWKGAFHFFHIPPSTWVKLLALGRLVFSLRLSIHSGRSTAW